MPIEAAGLALTVTVVEPVAEQLLAIFNYLYVMNLRYAIILQGNIAYELIEHLIGKIAGKRIVTSSILMNKI